MHQEELTTQILMNGEVRKKNRMDFLNEGSRARQQMEADRLKLEAIKSHKLGSLHSQGVPEKYTVDLSNKKSSLECAGAGGWVARRGAQTMLPCAWLAGLCLLVFGVSSCVDRCILE